MHCVNLTHIFHHLIIVNLREEKFNAEVDVVLFMLLVFVSFVNHFLVNEDCLRVVDEGRVEPEVENLFTLMVKLDFYIVIEEQVWFSLDKEMVERRIHDSLLAVCIRFFVVIVENASLARYLKVWVKWSFFNLWNCQHGDLVQLVNRSWEHPFWILFNDTLFHEMFKIVDVPHLRWNSDSFLIFSPYCSVIDKCF